MIFFDVVLLLLETNELGENGRDGLAANQLQGMFGKRNNVMKKLLFSAHIHLLFRLVFFFNWFFSFA